MINLKDEFKKVLGDKSQDLVNELENILNECSESQEEILLNIKNVIEKSTKDLINGKISKDEYKELMGNVLDLTKINFLKIKVTNKIKVENLVIKLRNIVLTKLMESIVI